MIDIKPEDIKPDKSRTSDEAPKTINMDDPADIQRGYFAKPSFFADIAMSAAFAAFDTAVETSSNYSGWTDNYQLKLTIAQRNKLIVVATSIAERFPINMEAIRDFLTILCCISNYDDMVKIADAVELESLYDETIVGKPDRILAIEDLYKVAFVANAVDGILKLFSRYLGARASTPQGTGKTMDKIFSLLGGGSLDVGAALRLAAPEASGALGNFMSELLTGKRIPMTMIAKNPNLQIPSYIGQAFLGEAATALSNVDILQTFAKKIAVFPKPGNGSGATAFSFQNSMSLTKSMSIEQLAGKVLFGSESIGTIAKQALVSTAVSKLNVLTGVLSGEKLEPSRADTAIPLLAAMSSLQSGTDKPIFPAEIFQEGWTLASGISNHLAKVDSNYLAAFRQLT